MSAGESVTRQPGELDSGDAHSGNPQNKRDARDGLQPPVIRGVRQETHAKGRTTEASIKGMGEGFGHLRRRQSSNLLGIELI
jgi:hypothetical protein